MTGRAAWGVLRSQRINQCWLAVADAENDVAWHRHKQKSNYALVDGHVALLPIIRTYNPPEVDLWNPSLAQ